MMMVPPSRAPIEPRKADTDYPAPNTRQPPANPCYEVLYRDCRYVVVNKPADVRMDGDFEHTVEKYVLCVVSGDPTVDHKVRLVHRLDYATSGVVLCGLTRAAAGIAAEQFESRGVSKKYLALLHGHVDRDVAEWNWPIADGPGFLMEVGCADNPGRPARSRCEVLAIGTYQGAKITKVRLSPETGRRHQLRVHALAFGHPIVGDATYCANEEALFMGSGEFQAPRMMLHACQLDIKLPPSNVVVHGRKSGRHLAKPNSFTAWDPFIPEVLPGLELGSRGEDC